MTRREKRGEKAMRAIGSTLACATLAVAPALPAAADTLKDPASYVLSIANAEHTVYVGAVARPATIAFANVELTFPPSIDGVRLYKRIPAEDNDGGWVGQVIMAVAPIDKITRPHYAFCRVEGVQTVSFSVQIGTGPITYTNVAVKDNFVMSPPFTFNTKDPTYVELTSADPVQPPLSSAMKKTWYFSKCEIGAPYSGTKVR